MVFVVGEYYVFEVKGDLMIDVGINDGDVVVICEISIVDNGDIVVALVEDQEATLKRFSGAAPLWRLKRPTRPMKPACCPRIRSRCRAGWLA